MLVYTGSADEEVDVRVGSEVGGRAVRFGGGGERVGGDGALGGVEGGVAEGDDGVFWGVEEVGEVCEGGPCHVGGEADQGDADGWHGGGGRGRGFVRVKMSLRRELMRVFGW